MASNEYVFKQTAEQIQAAIDNASSPDTTLTKAGGLADAKVVGDALRKKASENHGNHVPATQTADDATFLRNDNTWQKVTPEKIGASPKGHGHSYNELTDKPTIPSVPSSLPANGGNADTLEGKHASEFASASHNQSASTITAGTLAGQVVANANGQDAGTSLLRNSKLVSADTEPTVNGEICWTYK